MALLRSASGRWVKQKFAPASLWPQSSAMVQRRRRRSGSRHNSKWCWGLCRFFLSIRPQMLRTAGFEHSLSGSANRSAATTCSSRLMLLRLVIPWLVTTQGSLLRCEAYNERTGFVPLKGKILFLEEALSMARRSSRLTTRNLTAHGDERYFACFAHTISYARSNVTNIRQIFFDLQVNQCMALL